MGIIVPDAKRLVKENTGPGDTQTGVGVYVLHAARASMHAPRTASPGPSTTLSPGSAKLKRNDMPPGRRCGACSAADGCSHHPVRPQHHLKVHLPHGRSPAGTSSLMAARLYPRRQGRTGGESGICHPAQAILRPFVSLGSEKSRLKPSQLFEKE